MTEKEMLELVNLSYLAGLLDGEGNITITKCHPPLRYRTSANKIYTFSVRVAITNRTIVEWLKETFGGTIYLRKAKSPKHKDCYVWTIQRNPAMELMRKVKKFLKIKNRQAEVGINFQEKFNRVVSTRTGNQPRLSFKIISEREMLHEAMIKLNKKGPDLEGDPDCE